MPVYDYECATCGYCMLDKHIAYADRDTPTHDPCPQCGTTTIERLACAPNVGDSVRIGRTNLPSTWTDKLQQIKSKHHRSTIKIPSPAKREI